MTCYLSELIDRLGGTKKSRLGEKFALNSRYLIGKRSDPKRIKSRLSYERRYINTFGTLKSFEKHKQADKCYERCREHSTFHPAAPDLISTKCHHSRCKENSVKRIASGKPQLFQVLCLGYGKSFRRGGSSCSVHEIVGPRWVSSPSLRWRAFLSRSDQR